MSAFHPRIFMLVATLITALCMGGCGGGFDEAASSASAAQDQAQGVKSKSRAKLAWTACAAEGGTCSFAGNRTVRYGTASAFVDKLILNGTACNNAVFGDPAIGQAKTCSYVAAHWSPCATEGAQCAFTGTLNVRYGVGLKFVIKEFTDGVMCSNDNFKDPAIGAGKSCWVLQPDAPAGVGTDPECDRLPPLPTLPASYKLVTSFCVNGKCAKPDDDQDDTDAIDAALDQSAGSFLVFPPGKYLISRSLRVKRAGVTLWGPGATIHATNVDDQSIIIESDNTSIYSFTLTAVTDVRRSRAEDTRIAIYGPAGVNPNVKNTVIRNNQIINAGDPGTALANSASGAGIFVNGADGFLIAGNTVARSLADGIHITGGSRNGRVLGNVVRETGDDMIALVSYAYPDPYANSAATIAGNFAGNMATYQDTNVLVSGNSLSGQYWGRGISVVGGRGVTIRSNLLSNIPYAAAIYLVRESQSGTYGLDNVVVEKNTISNVQTLQPPYDFQDKFKSASRTGHGAIEISGSMFVDELAYPDMVTGFAVSGLAIRDNSITSSATPALRVGIGSGSTWQMGSRAVNGNARLTGISFDRNAMRDIRNSLAMQFLNPEGIASCTGDTRDGLLAAGTCTAPPAPAAPTGAALVCPKG